MKEAVLYPYPFPCYLVDKVTFKEKVQGDSMWMEYMEDNHKDQINGFPIKDMISSMKTLVRCAVRDQQRVYFSWKDRTMYVEEYQ